MGIRIILIISVLVLFFCIYQLLYLFFKGMKIKRMFIEFLKKENDSEGLEKIGAIDSYGQECYRRVFYPLVQDFILRKYELTKKEEYIEFDKNMIDGMNNGFFSLFLLLLSIILVSYTKSLF